jgi:protein-S-isoprenylcysteine O-methyltransferase Ste14
MLRLPPPVWALIFLALAWTSDRFTPLSAPPEIRSVPLGVALVALGLGLTLWAAMLFRREGTEILPTSPTNKKLVVRGPFRFTRNPMYLGLVTASLGIAFWVGAAPMFAVPILVFATANWVHIPFEEAKMRRQFGAAFDDYCRRTRRWI